MLDAELESLPRLIAESVEPMPDIDDPAFGSALRHIHVGKRSNALSSPVTPLSEQTGRRRNLSLRPLIRTG